ncbi:MAG: glycosyltransferase family 39 protein [Solirubrobacteraceae bacterium]
MASSAPGQPITRQHDHASRRDAARAGGGLARWWPLAALLVLAAAVRLPTLSLQSLWYDEAFTPVHVLHPSLVATLNAVVARENTPPLWYVLVWGISRLLGTGVVALRLASALAGIALAGVGWAIGAQLGSRRTAIMLAAILALNPLFVWYSQEARAYELYALASAVSLLFFLRAYRGGGRALLALWALSSVLALVSHYFAVFLVAPEALLLLARLRPLGWTTPWSKAAAGAPATGAASVAVQPASAVRRRTLLAVGAVTACGAALVPLVVAQAGRGTQWIGEWALSDRLIQTPGYYLLGANGSVLGHGLLALSALPLIATAILARRLLAKRRLAHAELEGLALMLGLGIVAILIPLALALAGKDYFAPRNLIADWIPLSAAVALVLGAGAAGRVGAVLAVVLCLGATTVLVATVFDPRLQRSDWSAVANELRTGSRDRAIVTVELGAAPLEYYLPRLRLRYLSRRLTVSVREVDLVGYAPLRPGALRAPTPAFALAGRSNVHGLLAYRYTARTPQRLSGRFLRGLTVTVGAESSEETLLPAAIPARRS